MFNRSSLFVSLFAPCFLTASLLNSGCSADAADGSASGRSNLSTTIDSKGTDVQTLQVWTPKRLLPIDRPWLRGQAGTTVALGAETTSCTTLDTRSSPQSTWRQNDCTDGFQQAMPFDDGTTSPSLNPARFTFTDYQGTTSADPDYCEALEVRAVVKDAAFAAPSFKGIGFYSTRGGERFTNKSDLHAVGHVTLKSGEAATVFRFIGLSTCVSSAHSSTSGNMYQTFEFKPYALFETPSNDGATRYRVWESIEGNHRLGHSWPGSTPAINSTGFDRQGDLLTK